MYKVAYTREALRSLQAMPRNIAARIRQKIAGLVEDPFQAANVKALSGRPGYRLRVGDWRVIYEIEGDALVIHVLAVAPRGEAYK